MVFTSKHGDGPAVLVLRVRDCKYRALVSDAAKSKEVLAGFTGSVLADMVSLPCAFLRESCFCVVMLSSGEMYCSSWIRRTSRFTILDKELRL